MATLTLRPNAAGNQQGWDAEGGDYTRVDETSSDGDTTRLYTPTDNRVATFALENSSGQTGIINSVTVYINTKGLDPVSNTVQLALRTGSTDYFSNNRVYNNTSYHEESHTWYRNPNTNEGWTWSNIDGLEAGMKRITGGGQAVTQVWVVVDYDSGASFEQEGFRFRADDGSETTATWLASQDTNITRAESSLARLRILVNATGDPSTKRFGLYYKKTTDGTWLKMPNTGTDAFTLSPSSNIAASGASTTAQLTAPSGKTTSDFVTGRIQDDENPSDTIDVTTDDYTELEWAIIANAAAVDSGIYEFRVYIYQAGYTDNLCTGGTASASHENLPSEGAAKAFDGSYTSKWLANNTTPWLKYQFASSNKYAVTKYALTSGNDEAPRDPKDWKLQGSNDNSTWTDVDSRTGETFASRNLRKEYTCASNQTAYEYYRLNVSLNNGAATIVQLSELELYADNDQSIALGTYTVTPQWTIGTAAASDIKSVAGVAIASLKSVAGVLKANIKSVAGVSNV